MYTYLSRLNIDMARIAMIKPYMCCLPCPPYSDKSGLQNGVRGKGCKTKVIAAIYQYLALYVYQLTQSGESVYFSESGTEVSSV